MKTISRLLCFTAALLAAAQGYSQERKIGKGYLNLLAYWDFNSANSFKSGVVFDLVTKIEGELHGKPLLVAGRSGEKLDRAIDFGAEPAGNWVKIVHKMNDGTSWLKPVSDFNQLTISFWQKLHSRKSSSSFWLGAASASSGERNAQAHVPWGSGDIYWDTSGCCDGRTTRINKKWNGDFGEWHHYVFVKDHDRKAIYIDGELFHEGNNNSRFKADWTVSSIGSDNSGKSNVAGALDDFAVFASALTDDEIRRLAKGDAPVFLEERVGVGEPDEVLDRSASVKLGKTHGFFYEPFELTMNVKSPLAEIRYTIDSKEPTRGSGKIYSEPLMINKTTVIRAAAFEDGKAGSRVETQTYIFPDQVINKANMRKSITGHRVYGPKMLESLMSLPTMAITTGPAINGASETFGSLEFLPNDDSKGFQVNAGIRHFGGAWTNFSKKNFRIYFRKEYGVGKLRYPLFEGYDNGIEPVREFDQLNLRAGSHDMVQRGFYMSNRFTDDTMLEMGHINPHGRFVHLYIDGIYWGMYHLRERWNADMQANYLGGDKLDYEAINGNWNVGGWAEPGDPYDGDGLAWNRIKSYRGNYKKISSYLDVSNYIDFMLLFMFGHSEAEYRCVGPLDLGSGFKFFLNDADGFLRTSAGNRTNRGAPGRSSGDGPGSIFSMLIKENTSEYRMLLADRIHRHHFNDGVLTPSNNLARLNARVAEVDLAFLAESARWDYRSPSSWASARDKIINDWLPNRTSEVISQYRDAGLYPSIDAPLPSIPSGQIVEGEKLRFLSRHGKTYFTVDGIDPRMPNGNISESAIEFLDSTNERALISIGSTWKYSDTGENFGSSLLVEGHAVYSDSNWKHPKFNDSNWKSGKGEFGYGENDEITDLSYGDDVNNKHITSYFRHSFTIEKTDKLLAARLELKRDDGAIVYLNGHEVDRSNLRRGLVTGKTLAETASDDGNNFHEITVPIELIREGRNVFAVEVHQTKPTSSDVSFDFAFHVMEETEIKSEPLRIGKNIIVRSRAYKDGEWSALNENFYWTHSPVALGDLIFSEIHYNPKNNDDLEFIEIQNVSGGAVNLRGARFNSGVRYQFSKTQDTILTSGKRLLLVRSQYDMLKEFGAELPVHGVYQAGLSNKGERLELVNVEGESLLKVEYGDEYPWPEAADGNGPSLVFHGKSQLMNQPKEWFVGSEFGGSPGYGDATFYLKKPLLDSNENGKADLMDYVFGQDSNLPKFTVEQLRGDSGLEIVVAYTAWQNPASEDIKLAVEISHDLSTWLPLNINKTNLMESGRIECVWLHQVNANEHLATFYRLQIVRR